MLLNEGDRKLGVLERIPALALTFLIWTFFSYWLHRISHINSKYNPFFRLHMKHHTKVYPSKNFSIIPKWYNFLFFFGTIKETLDIWVIFELPLFVISYFSPSNGIPLLVFHYFYEIFLSDEILDHNVNIKGKITKIFAIGEFHLNHHHKVNKNFGFFVCLWDYVFGTAEINNHSKSH
jgi:sterol desaturase/sphingolipid hydroxylase (fatty acid hydroxylase superfamily)